MKCFVILGLSIFGWTALLCNGLLAAVTAVSATAPTIDGADISMLNLTSSFDIGGDQGHIWSNRPAQGQSFTTGADTLGYALGAVTLRNRGNTNDGSIATIRVGSISGTTFTLLSSETAAAVPNVPDNYVRYLLDAPVVLLPGSLHGFDVGVAGSGYVTDNNTDSNYAGGSAYSSGADGTGNTSITLHSDTGGSTGDRVFHLDLLAITPGSTSASSVAPVIDGADIAQLVGSTNIGGDEGHIWSDRPAQGQTFRTADDASGYLLDAITLQNLSNDTTSGNFTVQIGTINGDTLSPIATLTAEPVSYLSGDYITIQLEDPILLDADTLYGFDWTVDGSGFVTANSADNTAFLAGSAYSSGGGGLPNNNLLLLRGSDRVFHLNMTAVPEPSTFVLIAMGMIGLLVIRRQ